MTAEDLALFPELEPADRAHYAAARARLAANDHTDRAAYIRAKATGTSWTCPGACTEARGSDCECPCGRQCHGRRYCITH